MSKDAKIVEGCLEKLANGDFTFSIDEAVLRKNNSAGKMARLIKIIAEKEQKKTEAIKNLEDGRFESCSANGSSDMVLLSVEHIASMMKNVITQLNSVPEDINKGNYDAKFSESSLKGDYKLLALRLNEFLNTVISPISEANSVIKSICLNDFSAHIENSSSGLYSELINGLNQLANKLNEIQNAIIKVSEGDFSIVFSGESGENDKLTSSVLRITEMLKALAEETDVIKQKYINGEVIGTRADSEKFVGGYNEIVENINGILDSSSISLTECTDVLSAIAVNDLTKMFSGDLKGDYQKCSEAADNVRSHTGMIITTLQQVSEGNMSALDKLRSVGKLSENDELTPASIEMMESINSMLEETSKLAKAAEEGDLLFRVNTDVVRGEFASLLLNLNKTFDNITEPIIEICSIIEGLAVGDTKTKVTGDYKGVFGALKNDVNSITQQNQNIVSLITDILNEIANGNLNIEKVEDLQGDWNGIPTALNNILDSLNKLVGNIYNAVDEVAAGANQVSTGSQELSQGATEQASSIEELTASIAEIASQTKLNAKNAGTASTLAKSMRDSAISGNHEMSEMLTSMQEINESSRSISKIIKVIDDIAFQTNLLALNAAVEAARAGQHGKGFAVVAEEVRNLAARSANAANDTTALIEGSIKRVEKGTQIASNTAKTLGNIVNGVDKVAGLIENIAAASNEQATGITQINLGLEQVSKVVQTNSATAEQSAAASEELSGQASQLKCSVEKFNLRERDTADFIDNVPEDTVTEAAAADGSKALQDGIDNFGKY